MQKTMKALVKKYAKEGIWMDEVPVPSPGPLDVLIKVDKTAICGTDIHIYNWDAWAQKTIPVPMVVGHEFVGTVAAVGTYVKGFEIGELVSGEGHIVCGHCRNCLAGRRHWCKDTKGVGVNRPGSFAEYVCIPSCNVWKCDPKIPTDVLSCFDPFGNAVHTALTYDLLGEDVLITGAGPIGLMSAMIARHAGARFVVITDVNPWRLELAKKIGVTRAVDPRTTNLQTVMKDLGMREGFDVGLEMSGSGEALNNMVETMVHGGKIALLGILKPGTVIDWDKVVFGGLNIKGIYGRLMFETWYKMTTMIQTGLDISPLITHRFKIDEYQKAFDVMRSGSSGKVILTWS